MQIDPSAHQSRLEWIAIAVVTFVGLVLRLMPVGRLGLTHFDEGIYAIAGSWVFAPGGIASIDPMLIPYAPPGFPILIGLMYAILGPSDVAAIAVSQLAGTLSIPAAAWLARRSFGAGSGLAAATLAALSGPHIAFSRMALTDASFLLAWLIAIGAGMRFLERPTAWRGLSMGLAVGLAQQFKYNGWLAGALVILAAGLGALIRPEERCWGNLRRTIGWGLFGAVAAALVVLPWYSFVEAHGGYPALLRHQRSYLGGLARWLPSFRLQADQAVALSGSRGMVAWAWIASAAGGGFIGWLGRPRDRRSMQDLPLRLVLFATGGLVFVLIPNATWWLGLALAPGLIASRRPSTRLIGLWWLVLSLLTPFYHPYARLWLPIHAVGWVALGGTLGTGPDAVQPFRRRHRREAMPGDPGFLRLGLAWAWVLAVGTLWSIELGRAGDPPRILPGLLDPSDSLRVAADRVAAVVPDDVQELRLYGRPPLRFYLSGRVPLRPVADPENLFQGGEARIWALFDHGLNASSIWPRGRILWEPIEEIPNDFALPTVLDIDPRVARGGRNSTFIRSTTLDLFRHRSSKGPR